ncbi:DUF6507 family protein [Microbacterium sp. NPDC087665]|uniref:DUF6507 family protein n=1 Tax=Microbacterium sp. NPDC087665 TaxID=3364194 RepID=UPI00380965F4
MTHWRVDPDGVLGVLAGIDDLGPDFESVQTGISEAAMAASTLSVDGRTALSSAWEAFMEMRSLVPGKIMHSVRVAASGVGSATTAIVAGDEEMAADTQAAQSRAEDAWGIALPSAYQTPGFSRTP